MVINDSTDDVLVLCSRYRGRQDCYCSRRVHDPKVSMTLGSVHAEFYNGCLAYKVEWMGRSIEGTPHYAFKVVYNYT